MTQASVPIQYFEIENGASKTIEAEIITETPVSLTVNGDVWLTFMCTPTDLEAMALGFLFNEGVIKNMQEVVQVRLCAAGDNVDVWLEHNADKPDRWQRTSGCTGGVTSVNLDHLVAAEGSQNGSILTARQINEMVAGLFNSQDLYRKSGGVHTSVLTDGGEQHIMAEDIGRHNTLDKIAGLCLMQDVQLSHRVIITTGRISSEMLQKSARMGVSVVISRTSPSSLSIELAERLGITLIGYARRDSFRLYTHPQRISFTMEGITKSPVMR
jgi:FdhD protein